MRAVLAVIAVLVMALPAAAQGGTLVALGDSFSAGDGAPPYERGTTLGFRPCRRSPDAWPLLVARALGHSATHLACSGARMPEITDGLPRDWQPMRRVAQISRVPPTPDLVTLTIGGNDVGFAKVLKNCLEDPECDVDYGDGLDRRIRGKAAELARVYDVVRRRVGTARVVVSGYPRLFPATAIGNCAAFGLLSPKEAVYLNGRTRTLNRLIETLAGRAGFEYVDVEEAFDGGELRCGVGGYVNRVRSALVTFGELVPFHPNRAGYRRLAEVVLEGMAR